MPTKEIQRDPFATDDLTPYRGSWVALRDGKVVADALDAVELHERPEVQEDDRIMFVPTQAAGTFLL